MSVSRNAPCPCGSGKKYKKCCLRKDQTPAQEPQATETPQVSPQILQMLAPEVAQALRAGQEETALAQVEKAEADPEYFLQALSWLAYHGHLNLYLQVQRKAWTETELPDALRQWQSRGFLETALIFELMEYCQQHPQEKLSLRSPEVLQRLAVYTEGAPEEHAELGLLESSLQHLTGQAHTTWKKEDFTFTSQRERMRLDWDNYTEDEFDHGDAIHMPVATDPARERWMVFTFDFARYLHEQRGVPWSRGELAREAFESYILLRSDGNLRHLPGVETPTPFSSQNPSQTSAGSSKKPSRRNKFCPDSATLERFLNDRFGLLSGSLHMQAFAMLAHLPDWLAFLLSCQLIEAHHRDRTMRELHDIARTTVQFAASYFSSQPEEVEYFQQWYHQHWG